MAGDNRCLNRVVTGVGVGGALGASIGALEEEGRDGNGDAAASTSTSSSFFPLVLTRAQTPLLLSSTKNHSQAPSTARTRPFGTR